VTLNEIELAVYRRLNYADAPGSDVTTRIRQWLNIWHQRILAMPGFQGLRDTTFSFASVANQTQYALPQALTRIAKIYEQTSPRVLRLEQWSWIRDYDPQLVSTGVPEAYAQVSLREVGAQPATTGVWVVSTSAADVTQTATIEGIRTGGYRSGPVTATLSGTTRVALGTYTDYVELDKAFISATAAGVVSFYDAAVAGNELARISIGQTMARYQWIQLWPTPTDALTYYVDGQRVLEDMSQSTDQPMLPFEFHWLLVEAGCFEEWLRKADARAATAKQHLDDGIKSLRHWQWSLPDYQPQNLEQGDRPSRLGGMYPSWWLR